MTEAEILEMAIDHYVQLGYMVLYRTTDHVDGERPGADAILWHEKKNIYVFVEAKSSNGSAVGRSVRFSNVMGTLLKRIKVTGGYTCPSEALSGFHGHTDAARKAIRHQVRRHATLARSRYVIALDAAYRRVADSIDRELLDMLHTEFLFPLDTF